MQSMINTIKKLMRILERRTKSRLLLLIFAIIFGALLETAALSMIWQLIDILMGDMVIGESAAIRFFYETFGFGSVGTFLAALTYTVAGVYIFRGLYSFILIRVQAYFIARMQIKLADRLLKKNLEYSYLYHTGKNIAEQQTLIVADSTDLYTIVNHILLFLTDTFMALFMLSFLFVVSPAITLGVLCTALIFVFLYFKIFRRELVTAGRARRAARVGLTKSVNQALGGIKEVKLMQRSGYFHKVFKSFGKIYVRVTARFTVLDAVPKLFIESICFGIIFILIATFMLAGFDMTSIIPQLSVFVIAAFRILPAITRLVNHINKVINGRVIVDVIHKSLFEDEDIGDIKLPELTAAEATVPVNGQGDIIITGLTFAYPKKPEKVLDGISLTIPENKSVAFIGPSGAGKTTLADLILGVLAPQSGAVLYRGKSIHHNFEWWCGNVGYIPQQIYLLDESILENVAFGLEREKIDTDKVASALRQAQLEDFVNSLPDGAETTIGDRGVRLSGGQRQRIGIARALYNNPSILVLDEATSSLDSDTEKAVMEAMEKFRGEKTMIIIAHRLSTIENCDIIYRVEGGAVIRER